MTRSLSVAVLAILFFAASSGHGADASPTQTASAHFTVAYGPETSLDYVRLVERGLESAYDLFVVRSSFGTFPGSIDVRIASDGADAMGAEYLDTNAAGDPIPVIEIAPEATMAAAADASVLGLSLEDAVLSTTAHEFFHVLQDYASLEGQGDVAESSFVEPLATAVQEIAAPNANDYVEAARDFLLAPDAMSFFDRGYDAGLFWVFVLDRYGGLDAIHRVMQASAGADGARAIDRAFAAQGITFLDLWAKFAAALATGTLPDESALTKLARVSALEAGLSNLTFPPPIAVARWTGVPMTLDRVTEDSPEDTLLGYSDSAVNAPLRISYPYGIDVVTIRPESATPLIVTVVASESADFRIAFVGRRETEWDLLSMSGRVLSVTDPDRFDEIRIVLTRGGTGSGSFTVRLSRGS